MKKTFLLIALLSLSVNSMAEDVGLKCDSEYKTKLFVFNDIEVDPMDVVVQTDMPLFFALPEKGIFERGKDRLNDLLERNKKSQAEKENKETSKSKIIKKIVSEFIILEGRWSSTVDVRSTPSTYKFYFSNSGYRAYKKKVSYSVNRSNLSMVSHEEECINGTTSFCSKYQIVSQDTNWQCKKYTAESIREYAAEQLEELTKGNQF